MGISWRVVTRVVSALLLLGGLAGSRSAHADVSGQAYQDIKHVIEDLLTTEVARTVVPQVACRAGRTEREALEPECTLANGGGLIEPKAPDEICVARGETYVVYKLRALQYFPATLQALYSRRFSSLKSAVASEAIGLATDRAYEALTKLQLAALSRKPADEDNAEALADTLVEDGGKTVFSEIATDAERDSCVRNVQAKLDAGISTASTLLDESCSPPTDENALACELALSLRASLRGNHAEEDVHVARAISIVVAAALTNKLAVTGEVRNTADAVAATLRDIVRKADPPDFTNLAKSLAKITGKTEAEVTAELTLVVPALQRLISRLQAVSALGTTNLSIRSVLTDVVDTLTDAKNFCAGNLADLPQCKLVSEITQRIGQASILWPLISAADAGDLRAVAHIVVLSIFEQVDGYSGCDPVDPKQDCKLDVYRRFADALVQFVLDAKDGEASDAVRSTFRTAAEEVVRYASPYGGFDRQARVFDHVFLVTPELGVRLVWSASYINESARDLRYIASLQMLRIRKRAWYTTRSYAEVQLSVLDPLAPFAEVAVRANKDFATGARVTYANTKVLALNVIAPRLEFTAGLPFISKHLAVAAGLSLRMEAPTKSTTLMDGSIRYEYIRLDRSGEDWFKFVEFGVAAKYLL